jgi:peptidoglycan/xylan/chitin deacetylase (PgdA/CDA1 family)
VNWLRGLAQLLSPAGRGARLSVLIFHRVLPSPDPLFPEEPDAERFALLLRWLRLQFDVLPLDQAIAALSQGRMPARALAITFDDGYADNHDVALPELRAQGLSATFFVASGFLDGGRMWNDTVVEAVRAAPGDELDLSALDLGRHRITSAAERRQAIDLLLPRIKYLTLAQREATVTALSRIAGASLPDNLMMSSAQLRALRAAGMGIGGHTRSHPILARLDDATAELEIRQGKADLEAILGEPITLFAYPNGKPDRDYAACHARMAHDAGYVAAVTTAPGAARHGADLFELPRFTPWDRTPTRFGLRLVNNLRVAVQKAA